MKTSRLRFDQRGRVVEADSSLGRWESDAEFAAHVAARVFPDPTIYRETVEQMRLRYAIENWARAVRERYECGAGPLECGGVCHRTPGHEPPCFCEGLDENGEETCPA